MRVSGYFFSRAIRSIRGLVLDDFFAPGFDSCKLGFIGGATLGAEQQFLPIQISREALPPGVELARAMPVGDPLDEKTKVGAIVSEQQYDKILGYIDQGRRGGARLQLEGEPLQILEGRFIATTIFDEVRPEMSIAREEIFGPGLSILTFDIAEEAIEEFTELKTIQMHLGPRSSWWAGQR